MSLEEKVKYIFSKFEDTFGTTGLYVQLKKLFPNERRDNILLILLKNHWHTEFTGNFDNFVIKGNNSKSGILYFELIYKVVKDLEREGKL